MATIILAGERVPATVDTGATSNFISEKLRDSLQPKLQSVPYAATVTLADGSQRQILEAADATIVFGSRKLQLRFLVMPDATEELLLGLDFLTKGEARLTCAGLTCNFGVSRKTHHHRTMITSLAANEPIVEGSKTPGHRTVSEHIRDDQVRITEFLEKELQCFRDIRGPSTITVHRITMEDDRPFKLPCKLSATGK